MTHSSAAPSRAETTEPEGAGKQPRRRSRIRAPELRGRGWLGTAGAEYRLTDFRGQFLLLDFWTFCCINCLHVIDELRGLEREFDEQLVIVGVHSPKFEHEREPAAVRAAVERYQLTHPVLDDPDLETWKQYAVKAWPTLVLIDPEGYIVHVAAGEGHVDALRALLSELVETHREWGTLRQRGDPHFVPDRTDATQLRFPHGLTAIAQEHGGESALAIADTAHHSVALLPADAEGRDPEASDTAELRRIGSGQRGHRDGPAPNAQFAEPSGVTLLPPQIARRVGYHMVVADTGNHLLRGVNLDTEEVLTIAGTGEQYRGAEPAAAGTATTTALTSPWDVEWYEPAGGVVVAMAGNHTLALLRPEEQVIEPFAGTTVEGLRDGPAAEAFFAQTSALAADGDRLWLVDAETSALRWIEPSSAGFDVHTAIGAGLFDFGHRDGHGDQALLQHPLGLSVLPDHTVAISDTYNGALRRYDPQTAQVSTMAQDLAEPTGAGVIDGQLVVAISAEHRLERPLPPGLAEELVTGTPQQIQRPATELAPGTVQLDVVFQAPPGQQLDERYGPATRLEVTASPPELLVGGSGAATGLQRNLQLADPASGGPREGVLHVVAQAAVCDSEAEHPVCRLSRQDWGVPLQLDPAGPSELPLLMGGLAP